LYELPAAEGTLGLLLLAAVAVAVLAAVVEAALLGVGLAPAPALAGPPLFPPFEASLLFEAGW